MKKEYDFSDGRRGAVLRVPSGKTRITIRIDDDILQWFRGQVHKAGGGSYQTLINDALRSFAESAGGHLEETLRRVLREELPQYRGRPKPGEKR
jgi:BrnA antitoxin of type II toxin-antitoxin system